MASDKQQQRSRRRQILGVGVRSVGRSVLHTVGGYDRAKSWQKTGQDWFDTLGNLKGAAMKLGQIAAQYQDFLPEQVTEQLARLQRDAEPWAFEHLTPVLDASLSSAQRARLTWIDEQALAAASIGQVHAARLDDGRDVVVKIRYPGVADAVDADIANLGRLLKLSRFIPMRGTDIDAVLGELRERFIEETDYRNELANLQIMRRFALPGYVLPEPVADLCTAAVLVTTRIDSAPIATAGPEIGHTMVEGICRQVFTFGALHADPHPGNFGLTAEDEIALYDFGCVKFLDEPTRRTLIALIAAGMDGRWQDVHTAMEQLGAVPPNRWRDDGAIYADIYARHASAALEPLKEQPHYVFSDDGLIERIHRETRCLAASLALFQRCPGDGVRAQNPQRAVLDHAPRGSRGRSLCASGKDRRRCIRPRSRCPLNQDVREPRIATCPTVLIAARTSAYASPALCSGGHDVYVAGVKHIGEQALTANIPGQPASGISH